MILWPLGPRILMNYYHKNIFANNKIKIDEWILSKIILGYSHFDEKIQKVCGKFVLVILVRNFINRKSV